MLRCKQDGDVLMTPLAAAPRGFAAPFMWQSRQ
jgi:hypothetical protein